MRLGSTALPAALLAPALAGAFIFPTPGAEGPPPSPPVAAATAPSADAEILDLRRDLLEILTTSGGGNGRWSVLAVSLDRGDTILALSPDQAMIPASNMKVLTSAAALHLLGPDFRFRTFLLGSGREVGGVLEGDLVLYGTGDPTLSGRFYPTASAPFDSLAEEVAARGIHAVAGDLVVDASYFQGPLLHPDWDPADFNDAFAAPVPSLSFNENLVTLRVEAAQAAGLAPVVHILPEGAQVPTRNGAVTTPRGSPRRLLLQRDALPDPIGIVGTMPLGGREVWRDLPVFDPLTFAAQEMERALAAAGIEVWGRVRMVGEPSTSPLAAGSADPVPGPPALRLLASRVSPPLLEILRVVNKESNNFFAESVAKTLGRVVDGDGSWAGGSRVVRRFLVEEVGLSPTTLQVRDGSGLSAQNRVSAGEMVRVLEYLAASDLWEDFWSTLPEAGVRRELTRMSRSPAAGNLRAKTGTMEGVSALSGMVRTRSGERILFSLLSNQVRSAYRAKGGEDQVGIRLASLTRPLSPDN